LNFFSGPIPFAQLMCQGHSFDVNVVFSSPLTSNHYMDNYASTILVLD